MSDNEPEKLYGNIFATRPTVFSADMKPRPGIT
jgi:hypothetical protein